MLHQVLTQNLHVVQTGAMTFAEHLKRPGRSLTEWAALADVSVATVSRWASGKSRPDVHQAEALAGKLGLPKHVLRPDIWQEGAAQ